MLIMPHTILEIKNLKREFHVGGETVKAIKGISFSIEQGEFVTIMGSSGSGKTTLLNILGCLDRPTSGEYILDQVAVKSLNRTSLARLRSRKIGFVFQAYNLLPRTNALENVELPLIYHSQVKSAERKRRAMEALKAVKLENRMFHEPSQLSGGQQQRVAIARAIVNAPIMILADEATGNLDTRTSYEIMTLFQDLNRQGKTIVFVTHEPDIATFSCRTIQLQDGRIVKDEMNLHVQSAKTALENLPGLDD